MDADASITYSFPETGTSDAGYTCSCGVFVPFGTSHSCHLTSAPTPARWDRMSDVRIADALERIAVALEQIAKGETG